LFHVHAYRIQLTAQIAQLRQTPKYYNEKARKGKVNYQIPKAPVAKRAVHIPHGSVGEIRGKFRFRLDLTVTEDRIKFGFFWGERNDVWFPLFADSNVLLVGLAVVIRVFWREMKHGRRDGTTGEWRNGSLDAIEESRVEWWLCWGQRYLALRLHSVWIR